MAGYTGGSEVVLAAGLAGTLASALSMGAGAYLASKSNREVYESEVSRERAEIEEDPHEELLELELFYQLKGFSSEEARTMAERIQKEPKQFLRTLVHEELGLSEETFPNPIRSTISAGLSTAVGGFIPIIPFFFTVGMPAVVPSFVISTIAHFVVGASKALVTTRSGGPAARNDDRGRDRSRYHLRPRRAFAGHCRARAGLCRLWSDESEPLMHFLDRPVLTMRQPEQGARPLWD
jgi:VIT1/CCC1 family predicted Fe2+/Mn2+ transporter